MACVKLENIQKVYAGGVHVVKDFNLEIEDQEFIVLVGPSGCGKSTTLRMIAGLESISDGKLFIGDKLVNKISPKDRDIAMVFQNYALYPHMTVFDNIAYAMKIRRTPKEEIKKRVHEVAEQLEITPYLNRKPKEMSGGQRQRVALGRAMVRNPAVFLLDEPLSNLDAKLRASMRIEITNLHKKLKTTFIYVTHDQTEAMTMADRIVIMQDGIIQQIDTPQNLYRYPINQFVAGFIGTPQMNFLPVTLRQNHGCYYADLRGNPIPLSEDYAYRDHIDKEVMLGIRPEHIRITREDVPDTIRANIVLQETMGAETYMHTEFGDQKLVLRIQDMELPEGMIAVTFIPEKIHLFDLKDGHRL